MQGLQNYPSVDAVMRATFPSSFLVPEELIALELKRRDDLDSIACITGMVDTPTWSHSYPTLAAYCEAPPLAHAHNSTPTQKDGASVSS